MSRPLSSRFPAVVAIAIAVATTVWAVPGLAQIDTVRVGSVALRVVPAGVDTVEHYNVENGTRTLSRVSVVQRSHEQFDGTSVLRIVAADGRTRTDARLNPSTLQLLRFERAGANDSTVFALQDGCFTGWTDLMNQPRRAIQCVRAADRFGSGALDATVLAALPLKTGWNVRVATFDAFGDITSYPIRVVQMDTIRLGNRAYAAWQVERLQGGNATISGGGTASSVEVKTTWWVDVATARVLQERQTVTIQGTTRESLKVLRNLVSTAQPNR